ncbi:hypothetical protein EYF80_025094 [Liparis tanakae]|uniref:Uncharacterized protein n=1 Tax=Liparis tanakae TaxID=230148 RepID=A0A4Z2HFN5_9TELE|nr:hypothetical protein EYF80_025094 [Liparis tanakae]
MAAPHSSCLRESLEARGKSLFFFKSVRAMMDTRDPSSFTMGSLPVGRIRGEVDVSRRDDAHQLAAHFSVVRDGDSTEAITSFGLEDVLNALAGAHHHRVCDEALLIALVVEGSKTRGKEGVFKHERVNVSMLGLLVLKLKEFTPKSSSLLSDAWLFMSTDIQSIESTPGRPAYLSDPSGSVGETIGGWYSSVCHSPNRARSFSSFCSDATLALRERFEKPLTI